MRKIIITSLITGLLLSMSVASASAHRLSVEPPGQDEPTLDQVVVSTDWAQAHCQAAAPAQATASSDVITFHPAEALDDCEPGVDAPGRTK